MEKYYQYQSWLRIIRTAYVDISGGGDLKIKYEKPSGATGEWTAIVTNALIAEGYYDVVDATILDELGIWKIWAYATNSAGKSAAGKVTLFEVIAEGT